MDTQKQAISKNVRLNLSVTEFSAISRLRLAVRDTGMRLVNGGAMVQLKIKENTRTLSFGKEHFEALVKLKENDKPGRVQLDMSWNSWCALSQIIDKLKECPAKAETVSFDLEDWQLKSLLSISQ